jgi:aspartate aminotransferase
LKSLSSTAEAVHASTTMAIDSKAKQMKADGVDVVGFGAGEPDFRTPDNINMAAMAAICEGKTKYTPASGIIPLKKAVCARLKADCGVSYDYPQIVIASGAKHVVYVALAVLLNPGDEVIVPGSVLGQLHRDDKNDRRRAGGGSGRERSRASRSRRPSLKAP